MCTISIRNVLPRDEPALQDITYRTGLKGRGLGSWMMCRIIQYARERGLREIYGEVLHENQGMLHINRALGFSKKSQPDDPGVMHVTLKL